MPIAVTGDVTPTRASRAEAAIIAPQDDRAAKRRPRMVKPIPDEYHTVTPYLIVEDAAGLMNFAKQVLGAQETVSMPGPDGKIGHAEMRIGDSVVMLSDGNPDSPPERATILVYVDD